MTTPSDIASFLLASPQSNCLGQLSMGADRRTSVWRNQNDLMRYRDPKGHTFGYYTQGGTGTQRLDGTRKRGWAGAVCVLPEGMDSDWEITDRFEFVHLYLSDQDMRHAFAETFDCDSRLMGFSDQTYFDAPALAQPFLVLHQATLAGDSLRAQEAVSEVVHGLFTHGIGINRHPQQVTGGLAPHQLRRIRDYVLSDLSRQIHLRDLAQLVGLSEFHLQRSFRRSLGLSPHQWITRKRIEAAQELIRKGEALAQVAIACGFANQSHLSRSFKARLGITPGAYARQV